MTFVFKDGYYRYGWKSFRQNYNEPVMRAGKEMTTCLLDVGEKGSVKAFVPVQVKGKNYDSPVQESVIKDGKGEKSYVLNGENNSFHIEARGEYWGMAKSEGSLYHLISYGGEQKDSWWME